MFAKSKSIYLATRKKNDLVFNHYFMRPLAAVTVAALEGTSVTPNQVTLLNFVVFVVAAAMLAAFPSWRGGALAVLVLEISYLFDCTDGMLARHKKIASKAGHLFDFFTDEAKALLLVALLGIRLYRAGGVGWDAAEWAPNDVRFLFAAIAGSVIVASATSLTNFVRRPELSGKEQSVEAHYETVEAKAPTSLPGKIAHLAFSLLRFLNHYPSHIYLFAFFGRLDLFFWMYVALNLLYLLRGWLGIFLRFGRARPV